MKNHRQKIFFLFLFLFLFDRIWILFHFNFQYTGSDDMIFWQAATDYSHGIFHEPYFYGQNYNFMLESLLAVPLLWLGIPCKYTLPLVSGAMAAFPFLLFSIVLYRRGFFLQAILFLCVPFLLSLNYTMLSSLSRGFVSGLFFSGFLVYPLLEPENKKYHIVGAIAMSIGYILNPNSLVLSIPVLVYLCLYNFKKPIFYATGILCFVPFYLLEKLAKNFYKVHAEYNVSGMWDLEFSAKMLIRNFDNLNRFFGCYMPGIWNAGWLILVVLFLCGILLWKTDKRKSVAIFCGLLFIIGMLGLNKVNDGTNALFLSPERMFLAIPLLTALVLGWIGAGFKTPFKNGSVILGFLVICIFSVKLITSPKGIKNKTRETNYGPVAIKKITALETECRAFSDTIKKYQIGLVVFVPNYTLNVPEMEFYNYGCPLLERDFSPTVMNIYEKRTWVYQHEKEEVSANLLLVGNYIDSAMDKVTSNCRVLSRKPEMILIQGNKIPTEKLMKKFGVGFARNTY